MPLTTPYPILPAGPAKVWVFIGDSIVNGSSAANAAYAFPTEAVAAAGGMVASGYFHEAGTSGEQTSQMAARIQTCLNYDGAGAVVLMGGTNDTGAGRTVAEFAASMIEIISSVRARGFPLVICTVPPRGSSAAAGLHYLTLAYNLWIKQNAPVYGYTVADAYTALVDTTTGYLRADCDSGDAVHPNTLGHGIIGQKVAVAMIAATKMTAPFGLLQSKAPGWIGPDPLVVGGTTQPASWYEQPGGTGTAPTYSLVSDSGGWLPAGRWAQADISAGATTARTLAFTAGSAHTSGDMLVLAAHIEIDDVSGDWAANVAAGTASIGARINNGGVNVGPGMSRVVGIGTVGGTYRIGPLVVPHVTTAGYTANVWFSMNVPNGSHYKFRIGCAGLLNATLVGAGTAVFPNPDGSVQNH